MELRDNQPTQHEIGNRTYIVADVEPLDLDGVRTVEVGTIAFLIGFVALLPFYGSLADDGRTWWLWTCLAGFGLGLFGIEYCRRRRIAPQAAATSRRPKQPGLEPGSPGLDLVHGERVEDVVGDRDRLVLLGEPHLGVGAAAVVERHDPAVVVGVAVGADAERVGQRAGDPDQEAARVAAVGRALGQRRVRAAVAVGPALGREVATLG